jgi:DNA-binding MarR family transcriptional regulator
MTHTTIPDVLDEVAVGDLTAFESLRVFRDALKNEEDEGIFQIAYEALRSVAWKKLSSRTTGDEMMEWHDAFRQAAALFDDRGLSSLSERTLVLSELVLESARFASMNVPQDMMRRPHVVSILEAICALGVDTPREDVRKRTGLGQANLSRILASLISAGLVDRKRAGREALLSLTSLARELMNPTPDDSDELLDIDPPLKPDGSAAVTG